MVDCGIMHILIAWNKPSVSSGASLNLEALYGSPKGLWGFKGFYSLAGPMASIVYGT